MTGDPLVTCIMPTRNRRAFVEQAVWYFLRQDYPHRELIVLDDGGLSVEDLLPDDDRIRHLRLTERTSVGAKRNIGCQLAHGELIAHWDDDDWFGPGRLSAQVRELVLSGSDLCGADELLHYRLMAGDAWLFRPKAAGHRWVASGTLVYRRALWEQVPFADVDLGEDTDFVRRVGTGRVRAVSDPPYYVAVVHDTNVAGRQFGGTRWEPRPFEEVTCRLALDLEFYAGLRNGEVRMPPPGAERTSISLASVFQPWDGYGLMAEYLALGMARSGARVNIVPLALDEDRLSSEFRSLLKASSPDPGSPALWFAPPSGVEERFPSASDLFVNTMWESDELPPQWTGTLHRARAVIVPTRFVARLCRRAGITVPVEVIPEGVDPGMYPYVERPERPGLTTLAVGPLVRRKHVAEAVAAWRQAFHGNPDARLILKGKHRIGAFDPGDPRIEIVVETEPDRSILHWYRRADVLLALGNEGFGLPMVEAMSTGLPVIALSSEGQGDMCEDAGDLVLPVPPAAWEPCDDTQLGEVGRRGVPSVEHVAAHLRWVAGHREQARDIGKAGSAWVARHRNVWDKGPAVLDAMERHMRQPRPLRHARTVWTPESASALRSYTASLVRTLSGVRLVWQRPASRGLRLLHVQQEGHEPGELDLTETVRAAALCGIPTAVTEHVVTAQARPWEHDATVLVATTEADAAILTARWPGKHVECIPYGCPDWFPPRTRRRERVVAVLDSAAVPASLAALQRCGGGELLLVAQAPAVPLQRSQESPQLHQLQRSQHVRHVPPPGCGEQLAGLLAAQADVVVLPAAPPKETARAVLASGIPVLAPRTPALADLRDVTYQPDDLTEGLEALLADTGLGSGCVERAREFCDRNSWARIAQRHLELWAALEAA